MKVVDMHCDTISGLYEKRGLGLREGLAENTMHVDLKKLQAGDSLLQNFALFVCLGETDQPWEQVVGMADLYEEELRANADKIAPVYRYEDIEKNCQAGKISALLTVEEGGVCLGELDHLRQLYQRGVRMMTLTWNYANELAYPAVNAAGSRSGDPFFPIENCVARRMHSQIRNANLQGVQSTPFYRKIDADRGLTEKGREFVTEMERMGMIVDVSHLSDAGFQDVLELTKKPFVASHSNARAVSSWVRNLTDDMIRKLAERGGVMGLNFCPSFLVETLSGKEPQGSIEDIVRHAKHIIQVGGIECIGLGSDFDGIRGHRELPDFSYMPRLADALVKSGLSEGEVEKIFSGNVLRVYKDIL